MNIFRFTGILIVLALILSACAPAATPPPPPPTATNPPPPPPTATPLPPTATPKPTEAPKTIVDIAAGDGRFKTLVAAVQAAGLVDTLKGAGPFTVFAPTDEAFAALPPGTVEGLLKEPAKLKDILTYHVVAGKVTAADAAKLTSAKTVQGAEISIKVDMGKVKINDAEVIAADVMAANGVIHVINKVIMPPKDIVDTAIADGRFKTLETALKAAGLVETLKGKGPFTVFAPTDDAFKKIPAATLDALIKDVPQLKNVLLYHVVEGNVLAADVVKLKSAKTVLGKEVTIKVDGSKVMINDAQVIITDIKTANGVIHVIDTVLLPPKNIVETAVADGRFKTLETALKAAGLVETLQGKGPFTVFAPTDDAFKKIPAATLDALIKDVPQLKNVLLYHVVEGNVLAADVVKLKSAKTVLGKDVTIKVDGSKVFINNAQVIITDIKTSNGTIHVIDTVLLPPQ